MRKMWTPSAKESQKLLTAEIAENTKEIAEDAPNKFLFTGQSEDEGWQNKQQ